MSRASIATAAGAMCIAAGVLVNRWSLERIVAADEHIEAQSVRLAIIAAQVVAVAVGIALLTKLRRNLPVWLSGAALAGAAVAVVVGVYGTLKATHIVDPLRSERTNWNRMFAEEELALALEPSLRRLESDVRNFALGESDLFISKGPLWPKLADRIAYFRDARFSFVTVDGTNDDLTALRTRVVFEARARTVDGKLAWVRGDQLLDWAKNREAWRISAWKQVSLDVTETPEPAFADVSLAAFSPSEDFVRRSRHAEFVLESIKQGDSFEKPHPEFHHMSIARHPGVSVVDINGDGWDDLYVMPRWGANRLFINRQDGTFTESAKSFGLDIEDYSTAAIFADFDNDGDLDAFVGRSLAPSVYLEQADGRFTDRSALFGGELPRRVSSVSAADVDGDGWLDIYVSTYYGYLDRSDTRADLDLDLTDAEKDLVARHRDANPNLDLLGPPNALFRNRGGKGFRRDDESALRALRNTFQTTFADLDGDGDLDAFLANDFAQNLVFANNGDGQFQDITERWGADEHGFSMGITFGDFDHDGDQDAYVSNMYSKAGKRISGKIGFDPRLARLADGNILFRNDGSTLSVAGEASAATANAGWSWGGQFVDLDNDGALDLYVPSGNYTPPPEVELAGDS